MKGCAEVLENVLVNHGEENSNMDICDSNRIRKMKSERQTNTQYASNREASLRTGKLSLPMVKDNFFPVGLEMNWEMMDSDRDYFGI